MATLLTGDSEQAERLYCAEHRPELVRDCAVLKLAHHGSRNGTDARWLALVRPRLAVVSVDTGNDYGPPTPRPSPCWTAVASPCCAQTRAARSRSVATGPANRSSGAYTASGGLPPGTPKSTRLLPPPQTIGIAFGCASGRPQDRFDLNTATEAELETLLDVGPAIARRIIEGRPYRSVAELRRVHGIGPTRLAEIEPHVTVR